MGRLAALAVRAALALAAGWALLVGGAGPAAAHAELVSTSPADRGRVDQPPAELLLAFTEPVSIPDNGIRVVDADGRPVEVGEPEVTGGTAVVPVPAGSLGEGTFVVSWRAISADSHPISGAFSFTVGDGPAASPERVAALVGGDGDTPWEVAGAVARAFAYVGALLAAGGAFHLAAVDPDGSPRSVYRLVQAAALVGTAGLLAALLTRAALVSGRGAWSLFEAPVARDVLAVRVGPSITVTLLGLAAVQAGLPLPGRGGRVLLAAGAAAAVVGFALAGHTTETDPEWLATAGDVVHASAGAVWFGGLAALALSLWARRREEPTGAAAVVGRFSAVAAASLGAVAVAGTALAWAEVRSLDALTSTTYGRLVIAKVALVAAVAAIGAYNRFRLVPVVVAAAGVPARAWQLLRRSVAAEVAGLLVAVVLTAVLVEVTPARTAAAQQPVTATAPLGDGTVEVRVPRPVAGAASLELVLTGPDGERLEVADDAVTVELRHPDAGIGPIAREATPIAPGRLQVDGRDLTVPGTWEVTVTVRLSRFDEEDATVEVDLTGP